jgi:hypothetical protein
MHSRCRACARFLVPAYCCHLTGNKPQSEILLPNCCQFTVSNHAFSFASVRNLPRENDFCLGAKLVLQTAALPLGYPAVILDPGLMSGAFASHPPVSPIRQLLAAFPICPNLSACLGDQLRIAPNNEKTEHQYYPDGRKVNGKPMALLLGVSHL